MSRYSDAQHHIRKVRPRQMSYLATKRPWILAAVILFICTMTGFAQTSYTTDPNQAQGVHAYQTYDGVNENINLQSGNLHLCITLVSLPGRNGHDLTIPLCYNSQFNNFTYEGASDEVFVTTEVTPGFGGWDTQGWSLVGPTPIQYFTTSDSPQGNYPSQYTICAESGFTVVTTDGSAHQFPGVQNGCESYSCPSPAQGQSPPPCTEESGPNILIGAAFEPDSFVANISSTATTALYLPDSTRVQGDSWVDTNGNAISTGGPPWTDSIGRQVTVMGPESTSTSIIYPGSNGPETVTLYQGYIVMPNHLTYTVQYDSNGELSKITYPSGGYTRYVYAGPNFTPVGTGGLVVTQKFVCPAPAMTPGATSVPSGNTCPVAELETDYVAAPGTGNAQNNSQVTVVDPVGNQTVYTFSQPVGGDYSVPAVELQRQIYTGNTYRSGASATLLRTIQTQYSTYQQQQLLQTMPADSGCTPVQSLNGYLWPTVPTCVLTTLENGMVSKTEYQYDLHDMTLNTSVLTETRQYDYGSGAPGSLIRKTDDDWLDRDAPQLYGSALLGGSSQNILNHKTSEIVHDGNGNTIAQTKYIYDNADGGGPGNLTTTQQCCNAGAWLSTVNNYDGFGNVISTQDPKGNLTSFGYTDNYTDGTNRLSNAFLTSTTKTVNGSAQTTQNQYYYGSGLVAATCGANFGSATGCAANLGNRPDYASYQYDSMGRMVLASRGDGGSTSICYSDNGCSTALAANQNANPAPNANAIRVTSTKTISTASGASKVTTQVLDGLARVQNQLASDPSCTTGPVEVDTAYDGDGRQASVSNPYCSPASSALSTSYSYDGLNRPTLLTHPDGAWASTTYFGRAVESTDEGNGTVRIQRIVQSDALSRQTAVCEVSSTTQQGTFNTPASCGLDIGGTGFVTGYSYTYASTGNLTFNISQGGVSRSFISNPLSWLISASNPESGTTTYSYDNDGNVFTKTDARGVVSNYTYDALNRLTGKWYQNETTPSACFMYDQSTRGVGRLSTEWTQNGGSACPTTPPSSGLLTERNIPTYDLMGNVSTDQQCAPPMNCNNSTYDAFSYTYDQAENVTSLTNGLSGSSALSYWKQYDAVNRLCWIGAQQPSGLCTSPGLYAVQIFSPAGGIANATLGPTMSRHRDYSSSRLWPIDEIDSGGTTAGTATIQLTGAEQMYGLSHGSITFSGAEQAPILENGSLEYDAGLLIVEIAGTGYQIQYNQNSTPQTLATNLAEELSCSYGPVQGIVDPNGYTVDLTSCSSGANTNYAISAYQDGHTWAFPQYSFNVTASGSTMTIPQSSAPNQVVFSGTEQSGQVGMFTIAVVKSTGGTTNVISLTWGAGSTPSSLASSLASAIGSCSTSGVVVGGSANGPVMTLVPCQTGTTTYSVEGNLDYYTGGTSADFTATMSAGAIYDAGTLTLTVNGTPIASASYGQGSTLAGVISSLVSSSSGNGLVNVSSSGSDLLLTALDYGTGADYSYALNVAYNSSTFSWPSFSASPASGSLTGGQNAPIYSWTIPSYAPDGDVKSMTDTVMGTWTYGYDDLNRLSTGGSSAGMNLGWTYDRYGNRWSQAATGSSGSANQSSLSFTGNTNRIDGWSYDADGDLLSDGFNSYTYDAENRIVTAAATTYVYDAEGRRVAKMSGSTVTSMYLLGLNGEQVTELNGSGQWVHSNLFADGQLLATYLPGTNAGYHYRMTDWLGSLRMQVNAAGPQELTCSSYPFGDGQCATAATEQQFTSKEYDAESGNDYFVARYYRSNIGRFMNPDPSGEYYADPQNPQNLNLYSYALNNPLTFIDPSGMWHCEWSPGDSDDTQENGGASEDECDNQGGAWEIDPWDLPPAPQYQLTVTGYLGSSGGGGGGGSTGGSAAPSKVNCNTVLPNGKTLGQYINQGRAQMQASANASGALNGGLLTTFASIAVDYGQIDFKNGAAGTSVLANRAVLGQAGNFAYYAIGSGYLSPGLMDAGAGAYAVTSALLGKKSFSSLTGPMFSDASAASVRNAGLATPGCPQ